MSAPWLDMSPVCVGCEEPQSGCVCGGAYELEDPEREYLATHGPAKHAATSRLIDDLMHFADSVPGDLCQCDEGSRCRAHCAVDRVVQRAHRNGTVDRLPAAVRRFVRLAETFKARRRAEKRQ